MSTSTPARIRAWATRRRLYGASGHRGSYVRHKAILCVRCERMTRLIVKLYAEGTLSEGQAAKATGRGRVWLRIAAETEAEAALDTVKEKL